MALSAARSGASAYAASNTTGLQDVREPTPYHMVISELQSILDGRHQSWPSDQELANGMARVAAQYRKVFSAALMQEQQAEEQAVHTRLNKWPLWKQKKLGFCLTGLRAEVHGELMGDSVVALRAQGKGALPIHRFQARSLVMLSKRDTGQMQATVLEVQPAEILVVMRDVSGLRRNRLDHGWRLDMSSCPLPFQRSLEALQKVTDTKSAAPLLDGGRNQLRVLLLGPVPRAVLQKDANRRPTWMSPSKVEAAMATVPSRLNGSQRSAIRAALQRTVTLWHGPPGTGKTTTLVHYLAAVTEVLRGGGVRVLAAAASNTAVDNICRGLQELNVNVVRVASPVNVAGDVRNLTLEAQVLQHPLGKRADALRKQQRWDEAMQVKSQAEQAVLNESAVVTCTCISAGCPALSNHSFQICVIDEASQAAEPVSLVALAKAAESLLLVGDIKQLSPTVTCKASEQMGLGVSLFERLQKMGVQPLLLDTQYRMHPAIAAFPSATFYEGRLKSHPKPADRPAPAGFAWPQREAPIAFVNVATPEKGALEGAPQLHGSAAGGKMGSRQNTGEAEQVLRILRSLTKLDGLSYKDIGIISPYTAQVRLLKEQVSKQLRSAHALEIHTVDGFQGREKELIILSTVRSNPSQAIGFLADARRLNVAITRARRGLIIVGNCHTLRSNPLWQQYICWLQQQRVLMMQQQ